MSEAHEDEYDAVIPGAGSATEHDAGRAARVTTTTPTTWAVTARRSGASPAVSP